MLASTLSFFRNNPMPDTVFREITGNNIPHILITRNRDELIDQSISQFGNTAAYFGTGFLLDKLLNIFPSIFKWKSPHAKDYFFLGKSLSIFSLIASINLAMPHLRNYITTQRTHSSNYAELIGEKARTSHSALEVQQNLNQSKTRFIRTVSQGAALSLGILLSTLAVIYSGISFPKWLRRFPASWQKTAQRLKMGEGLATTLGLKNGQFKNFTPIAAIAFWVIPTFGGLLNAARDQYEVKELLLRFAAFNLAFFVFPITVEHAIEKWVKKARTIQWIGPKQNLAYLGKFISSLIFCSAVPTVLNIYLTRQRVKHDKAAATAHLKPNFFNLPK